MDAPGDTDIFDIWIMGSCVFADGVTNAGQSIYLQKEIRALFLLMFRKIILLSH